MTTPTDTRTPRPNFWLRAIEFRKHELARDGISDEDYSTTMATLEKMARNLGWDESQQGERPFGPGRGFGRGHRHPGMMRGFGGHPAHHESADTTPES